MQKLKKRNIHTSISFNLYMCIYIHAYIPSTSKNLYLHLSLYLYLHLSLHTFIPTHIYLYLHHLYQYLCWHLHWNLYLYYMHIHHTYQYIYTELFTPPDSRHACRASAWAAEALIAFGAAARAVAARQTVSNPSLFTLPAHICMTEITNQRNMFCISKTIPVTQHTVITWRVQKTNVKQCDFSSIDEFRCLDAIHHGDA